MRKDTNVINTLFTDLDADKNGKLSQTEVMNGLSKFLGPSIAKFECERIFYSAKITKENDEINFEQFMKAWANKFEILSDVRLKDTFKLLDADQSGKLSVQEIKGELELDGRSFDWGEMVKMVDVDGDNELDCTEFKKLIELIVN